MIFCLDYETFKIDDESSVDIRPLEVGDFQDLLQYVGKVNSEKSDDLETMGIKRMADKELSTLSQSIIPKYCQNLQGINIKESGTTRPAAIEDMLKYGMFTGTCLRILTALLNLSSLSEAEEKTVKKP